MYKQFNMWLFSIIYEIISFTISLILLYGVYPSPGKDTGASFFVLGIHFFLLALNMYFTTVMGAFANEKSRGDLYDQIKNSFIQTNTRDTDDGGENIVD